jgi:hypothetical protein
MLKVKKNRKYDLNNEPEGTPIFVGGTYSM